ncbi:hypothetical protein AMTR_s00009p00260910 [Amborella trichopoda]|uniref:histone acetyltransferase n=1 Tax=Amborella trichopoda TaxID=13333 RepID=W1NIZ1_AMBTC|nr:hypothetical protein AMTR_s00009p00260910 [Amborella trichopoda]
MVLLVLFIFLNLFPPEIITKPFTAGSVDNVEAFNRGVFNGGATTVSEMNQECNSLTENSCAIPCGHLNASQYVSSLEAKRPIHQQDQEQLDGSLDNGEAFDGGVFNGLENMTFTQLLQLDDLDVVKALNGGGFYGGSHTVSEINQEPNSLTANSSGIPDGDLNALQYFSLSEAKPHIGQQDQHQEHLIYQSPSSYQQNHWGNDPTNECHIVGHRFMPQKTMLSQKKRRFQSRNHLSDSTSGFQREEPKQGLLDMHLDSICTGSYHSHSPLMKQHGSEEVLRKSVPSHGEDLNAQSTGSMKCPLSKASSPQNRMLENPASEASKCVEWLVFLDHGSTCSAPAGQCSFYLCAYAQRIWMHISICEQIQCPFLYCRQLRKLWGLYCNCSDQDCLVCSCVCILISFHQPSDFWKVDLTRNSKEALSSAPLGDVQYPPKRMRAEHSSPIQFLPEPVASIPEVSDPEQVEESFQNEGPAVVELGDTPRLFYCSLTSAHGNPGTKMQNRKEPKCCSPKILSTVLSEDLQPPLKRMKFEHLPTKCISPEPLSQTSQFCDQVPVKAIADIEEPGFVVIKDTTMKMGSSPNFCHEIPGTKMDIGMEHTTPGFVLVKDTATKMGSSLTFGHEIPGNKMDNGMEHTTEVKEGIPLISSSELSSQITSENRTELNMCKMEMNQEPAILWVDCEAGTMHGKQKIQGASLLEFFTPEQITDHINSLRQCVGLSIKTNSKAEHCQAMESSVNQSSCQMCGMEKLSFAPPDVYCNQCGLLVKRDATYYTTSTREKQYYFCRKCFHGSCKRIEVERSKILKSSFDEKKHVGTLDEEWVQCDGCQSWNHQICSLFNKRKNYSEEAEYICPKCYLKGVEGGERKPLPQSALRSAKDLPTTFLSDHLEHRLFEGLKQERGERARRSGKNVNEVPGAEDLVIRVVSSVGKKLQVNQHFLDIVKDYPTEFSYKSKVILLFQKIEGVDVCLFCMHVQEYGSDCPYPNNRCVYLSYLDSVKYFQPAIVAATGEALRTFVYHEILVGYLEYCKKRGFVSFYIWVCPPLKGDDYIFYCHPNSQKSPKLGMLRQWYLKMIEKAKNEDIVVEQMDMYEQLFMRSCEKNAKITISRVPYFDGDYFPREAEYIIANIHIEEGKKRWKSGQRPASKVARENPTRVVVANDASKEVVLMQKLADSISEKKKEFIMLHMQYACTHCGQFVLTGKTRDCKPDENFCLCENCYDEEQKLHDKDWHANNKMETCDVTPVKMNVPSEIKDDEEIDNEIFHTRQAFFAFCAKNHFQFDTLRHAKHSSMMILDYLHNPRTLLDL